MLVPDSQACGYQISSTTPIPAAALAARTAKALALQAAVGNAQQASDALLVANPWEDWQGGLNLMKDIQRGNTQAAGAPAGSALPQLPGLPPAGSGGSLWDRLRRNVSVDRGRSANARPADQVKGWGSRFVTGPGGKFEYMGSRRGAGRGSVPLGRGYGGDARPGNCGTVDCTATAVPDCVVEPADVVPSDGLSPSGAPTDTGLPSPPPNPALRTEQPVNIIVEPPARYVPAAPVQYPSGGIVLPPQLPMQRLASASASVQGMGMWSDSVAKPGAVPADCSTMQRAGGGASSIPWWLWALGGAVLLVMATDETKTRRAARAGQKTTA